MTNDRITRYLELRSLDPRKIPLNALKIHRGLIPIDEVIAILSMISDDSFESFLDWYDSVCLQENRTQQNNT